MCQGVPGIEGVDTRALTKLIREKVTFLLLRVPTSEEPVHYLHFPKISDTALLLLLQGTMLGKLVVEGQDASSLAWSDPNSMNLVAEVSVAAPTVYNPEGSPGICAVDCGLKMNQVGGLRVMAPAIF